MLVSLSRRIGVLPLALIMVLGATSVGFGADPFPPAALPPVVIGGGLPSGYECSGAVWHSQYDKLFIVDDGGRISSLNSDGTDVNNWNLSGDLEGICVANPYSDFIYVGVENPDSIIEFNVTTGLATRSFNLTPWMTGAANSGLEALTFVPNAADPEGGLFYAGLQADGKIYSFRLPIESSSSSSTVTHVSTITPVAGRTDISGLNYDTAHQTLYAIYDSANKLRAMQGDGTFVAEWELPGNDQEGVALRGSDLYISEDYGNSGQVLHYSPFPAIPEPSSFALATLATLGLATYGWRRRSSR